LGEVGAHEGEARAGMAEDVAELLPVQLRIDRHGEEAGVPDREQRLQVLGAIGHGDRDPFARRHTRQFRERASDRPYPRGPLSVGRVHARPNRYAGAVRESPTVAVDPGGDVHSQPLPRPSVARSAGTVIGVTVAYCSFDSIALNWRETRR